jgi:hypothetical protein
MWTAASACTLSIAYPDGSFSATGHGATQASVSTGSFGELGFERNGVFLNHTNDGAAG